MNAGAAHLRVTGFPGRYIQGPGALQALPAAARELGGAHLLVVCDDTVHGAIGERLLETLSSSAMKASRLRFGGECTRAEIERLAALGRSSGGDLVVGLGGGKAIDTAKGIARSLRLPLVIAPTIASNDSATSRLIVLYDEAHRVIGFELLARNPYIVLVDTAEIVRAPVRFFRAGIGDALSKRLETAQCRLAGGRNFFGGRPPDTATTLSDACYAAIKAHGPAAVRDVASQRQTEAVESVVEATVLLSGLGFESGGLSLAHAFVRGFSGVPALAGALHGEIVAFGTVAQMVLEQRAASEIEEHIQLLSRMGMQASLAALGKATLTADELGTIAALTLAAPYAANFQRVLTPDEVIAAVLHADRLAGAQST
jgi:glycerol dehydrogenase